MKKQLFFAFLMLVGTTFAQSVSDYFFEQETLPIYMNITGGTQALSNTDDGEAPNIPIGFDFKYLGTTYNTVTIGANGAISFTASDVSFTNDLTSTASNRVNIVAPLWDDLFLRTADNGEVVYKTYGTAPFRKFAVEWKNASWRNAGSTVTFQLILHESINSIEFLYGSNNSTETRSASIGFNDAAGNFVSVTPGNPATVSTTTAVNNISTAEYPALKVYRFTPPTVNDYTYNAIDIPLTESCLEITANNVGATATGSAYTPDCGDYSGGDFWYRFTAPPYGAIKIKRLTVGGFGFLSYGIHKESDGYNTSNYTCGYIRDSELNQDFYVYNLEPGESYMLRVWEYRNNDFGTVTFCVSAANNDFNSNAFDLEVQPENAASYVETFANNVGATESPNPPTVYNFNGGDVWFKFTAPANGQLAVVHSDTAGDWSSFAFAIYDNYNQAPDADGIIYITGYSAPYTPVIINGLTAGTTYYLRAWDYGNDNFGVSPFYLREDTTVGINDHESLSFKYYPNPATDFINVTDNSNIHEISIVNLMGQEVKKATPESREVSLNIANLKQGIYLMKVRVGDKTSIVKIIKK